MTWLWPLWRWFAASKVAQIALMVVAALGGKVVYDRHQRSKGADDERQDMQDADRQRADDIRRRARDADGVQPDDDDRGYRD